MDVTREKIVEALGRIALPDGKDLVSADLVRALSVTDGAVRFVIEVPDPAAARGSDGAGMLLVGFLAWMPLGWISVSFAFGLSVAIGWSAGYFYYEYVHAMAHLAAPTSRYQRWLRKHHFHHHFGHPMSNHGVTVAWWDRVFGTLEVPDRVRVPRRMAQPWMLDEDGELRPEHADDYVLVGSADRTERLAQLDRAKAFASIAPDD